MENPVMRLHALSTALIVALAALAVERLAVQPQSRLWIEGASSVRSFACAAPAFDLTVTADGPGAVPAVLAAERVVNAVELAVPASKLDCGNGRMKMFGRIKVGDAVQVKFDLLLKS